MEGISKNRLLSHKETDGFLLLLGVGGGIEWCWYLYSGLCRVMLSSVCGKGQLSGRALSGSLFTLDERQKYGCLR